MKHVDHSLRSRRLTARRRARNRPDDYIVLRRYGDRDRRPSQNGPLSGTFDPDGSETVAALMESTMELPALEVA